MTEPPLPAGAPCAGLDYEHHEDHQTVSPDRWRCVKCGTEGTFSDFSRRLAPIMVTLERLREQMLDKGAVILMPSASPPKELGTIWGYYQLIRTGGISEPMIAVPSAKAAPIDLDANWLR